MPTHDPWLRRVQGLLAKAESTEFAEEAESLLAKAQELMTRHAIDAAMLAAAGADQDDAVVSQSLAMPTPYASAKAALLAAVAAANGCRCVSLGRARGPDRCTIVGFRTDVEKTTTLFAALSMHAARTMLAAEVPEHDTPRRFRHAFLLAFAGRIGARLAEAADTARSSATAERRGGPAVALVLADRDDEVQRAFEAEFPDVRRVTKRASSFAGAAAGRSAADRAPLDRTSLAPRQRGLTA